MPVRPVADTDVEAVVGLWRTHLRHDPISEATFRSTLLGDPNFEADGHLVAERNGAVVGFISAICRDGSAGRDGKGSADKAHIGYVRDLFGDADEALSELLDAALRFLHSRNKTRVLTGEYTGLYVTPGVDSRYNDLCEFLRGRFDAESSLDDMECDLTDWMPNDFQRRAEERASDYGVTVVEYEASMLPMMRRFAVELGISQWFPDGWEDGFRQGRSAFVAVRGTQIVGWTDYRPEGGALSLGPMGVAPIHRHRGIGTCLVLACMQEGRRRGLPRIWAGWTTTPFYVPSGWRVFREYLVFEKDLSG